MDQSAMLWQHIGPALIAALGLPKRTVWFELRCAVNESVTAKCEFYPDDGDLLAELAEYRLVRREPTSGVVSSKGGATLAATPNEATRSSLPIIPQPRGCHYS